MQAPDEDTLLRRRRVLRIIALALVLATAAAWLLSWEPGIILLFASLLLFAGVADLLHAYWWRQHVLARLANEPKA